jgi:hypothetical protein
VAENKKVTFSNGDVFDYLPMFAPRRLAHSAILADCVWLQALLPGLPHKYRDLWERLRFDVGA